MAGCQKTADVKHISYDYPPRAKSGNWPTVANLSGKTACFGRLAHSVARGGISHRAFDTATSDGNAKSQSAATDGTRNKHGFAGVICHFANFAIRLAKYFSHFTS